MFKANSINIIRTQLKSRPITQVTTRYLFQIQQVNPLFVNTQFRYFSTKNNDNPENTKEDQTKNESSIKKSRGKKLKKSDETQAATEQTEIKTKGKGKKKADSKDQEKQPVKKPEFQLYTLKFNSPILPYSKFPLTQNKYIQEFLRKYEEDKDKITKVLGVHFVDNNNSKAIDTIGIEIDIIKRNNITIVESNSNVRYKIKSYDEITNFCIAEEYEDELNLPAKANPSEVDPKYKDLLMSELFELKNLWFTFTKKINSMLTILPQEILNRYDMVSKTLQPPVFDIAKYPVENHFIETFNEVVYKMAQYYFSIFQAIFSKDNDTVKPAIQEFLTITDPILRSRKLIFYYDELHGLIDKKLYYVQKMAEEFKERSKTHLLEHAYQRVLEENKQSEKSKFQEKLNAIKNMPESTRKVIQEEVNNLEQKNDMDNARKIQYLNQIFRLPWDNRVDPFWDVQFSKNVLEETHYGMKETKERILEFIAKNKRMNSQKGMVILLTGPPGVGKTTIAKSIGDCLKRPTTVISMGGQNDPIHVKGSKRTYVDSQPGIFVKELQKLGCKNPVIVIDEIDKVGFNALKGDVSSTLLELLNPEQANTFRDNYLDIEFDFSECIFICTSNSTAHMLQPLLDRIEIIHVPAYLPIEKIKIAEKYLIPRCEQDYGFVQGNQDEIVKITRAALVKITEQYCQHEAGVRNLRKCLDRIFRKIVAKLEDKKLTESQKEILFNQSQQQIPQTPVETEQAAAASVSSPTLYKAEHPEKVVKEYQINTQNLEIFLDVPQTDDHYFFGINKQLPVGSSNGLAYVDDGQGSVLKIQFVQKIYGKKQPKEDKDDKEAGQVGHLTHTGRLGEVMKESVEVVKIAVFNFLVQNNISKDFDKNNYHLHVPMGSIPKDGPSAGLSLFSALVSIAIQKPVLKNLAMTGEITTLGEVIAIGGVREKLTACKNHQITRVILPYSNRKNVTKLPDEFKKGFTIFYAKNIEQVYKICFESEEQIEKGNFEQLKQIGVEVEQYEDDDISSRMIIDNEAISSRNSIEELLIQ